MSKTALCFSSATTLATLLRQRQVSPVEVVEALLARINEWNDRLRAYLHVDGERALTAARVAEMELARVGIVAYSTACLCPIRTSIIPRLFYIRLLMLRA